MVAAPTTTPLPTLSDQESHLLAAFLTYRYDMVTLAEREQLNPRQLLAFARSPAVQANLTALKTFADQAFALRSLESRILASDLLEQVAKTADNPIEKRRAASAILRGLCPVGGLPLRGGSRSNSPSLREGAGGREYGPPNRANHLNQSLPDVHSPLSTVHSPDPSTSPSPNPEPPRPLLTPSPNLPPDRIAHIAMKACNRRDQPDHIATLEAFLAPGATFNHEPVIDTASQAPRFHPNGAFSILPIGPETDNAAQVRLTSPEPPHFLFTFTRSPDGPHPNCWLIAEIHEDTS